jgi:hypothetical protein
VRAVHGSDSDVLMLSDALMTDDSVWAEAQPVEGTVKTTQALSVITLKNAFRTKISSDIMVLIKVL